MVTRSQILSKAVDECMKELYSLAQPHVEWEDFKQQCKDYSEEYKKIMYGNDKVKDFKKLGPKPYEFYYLPAEVMKEVCDSYVEAYRMDCQGELLSTINILKQYIQDPIKEVYTKDEDGVGQREYKHEKPLKNSILNITCDQKQTEEIYNKIEEYLDMAGNFYCWNSDLHSFNMSVYLGVSPHSKKETVIKNWKEYKGVDITIDDDVYKEDEHYYEEED
jgi:hypothetical protein